MINRELGLVEIYERLELVHVLIGLKTFRRNPTKPLRQEHLPYLIMDEGTDVILKHGDRRNHGYPARRSLEVQFEIAASKDLINGLFLDVRKACFAEKGTFENTPPTFNAIVSEHTFINENRTEGPTGIEIPDILVKRLVLDLVYTDNGF